MKSKYQFGGGSSTDFFNMVADQYKSSTQPSYEETELPEQIETDDFEDLSYEDLLERYQELEERLANMPETPQPQMQDNSLQGEAFLDFLFSDENKEPINFENYKPTSNGRQLGITTTSTSGINPKVTQTGKDLFSKYNLTNLGTWGDKSHQARKSDHNTGDAQDFGFDTKETAQATINQLQTEASQRGVKYIIHDGKIWNPSKSNEWRPYSGSNPHKDHIHVSYNRKYGGGKYKLAGTVSEQKEGLNNPNYDDMYFPMDGYNEFRGLDNGQPVQLQDALGNMQILSNPSQIALMYGGVKEKRL